MVVVMVTIGSLWVNCSNFDGYTNSVYTITVAAMDNHQSHPVYSEQCPGILFTMYSSARGGMEGIYTTDWKSGCTSRHGGTSAAAPLAAGVYALLLSKRRDLNWRDVQRISIENAVVVNPDDTDWKSNGAGRKYNHKYGYGTIDTYKLIMATEKYQNVRNQTIFVSEQDKLSKPIPQNTEGVVELISVTAEDLKKKSFGRLEHVTVAIYIDHQRRGDISIYLTSPSGFESRLIESRSGDHDDTGFDGWTMLSVAHW
jgi:kexin